MSAPPVGPRRGAAGPAAVWCATRQTGVARSLLPPAFTLEKRAILLLFLAFLAWGPVVVAAATKDAAEDIAPLRPALPEIPPTFWEQYGLWMILAGVLLVVIICAGAWLLTRPKPPPLVPPEAVARQALEPLRGQPETGALLSRVSQILRHYAAAAFDLGTGELTTNEFCLAAASQPQLGPDLADALSQFLRQCDQRKFAPAPPQPPLGAVAQAEKLVALGESRRLVLGQSRLPVVERGTEEPAC